MASKAKLALFACLSAAVGLGTYWFLAYADSVIGGGKALHMEIGARGRKVTTGQVKANMQSTEPVNCGMLCQRWGPYAKTNGTCTLAANACQGIGELRPNDGVGWNTCF